MANVLNVTLECPACEQGPGMGGAMLAMVADGVYPTVKDAVNAIVRTASTVEPEPELVALYEKQYQKFSKIYPAMKELFPAIQ